MYRNFSEFPYLPIGPWTTVEFDQTSLCGSSPSGIFKWLEREIPFVRGYITLFHPQRLFFPSASAGQGEYCILQEGKRRPDWALLEGCKSITLAPWQKTLVRAHFLQGRLHCAAQIMIQI